MLGIDTCDVCGKGNCPHHGEDEAEMSFVWMRDMYGNITPARYVKSGEE